MSNDDRQAQQARERHRKRLGEIVKHLRAQAGLTRYELGQRVLLADALVRSLERGTAVLTKAQWERLTQAPAMEQLAQWVGQEGVEVEFADDPRPLGEKK